jgi:hypothetical protein
MHDIDTIRMEYEHEGEGFNYEGEFEMEAPLNETEEEVLASELLGVTSEAELDQFFGKLFKRVSKGVKGVGKFLSKNAGPLAGALKGIAKTALPTVGAALGSAIPIPGVGTAIGGMLGNAASNMLEAELEGLNDEDREFEMAKRVVRLTGQAAKAGARRPPTMNRRGAILAALKDAMRRMRAQQIARSRARAAHGFGAAAGTSQPSQSVAGTDAGAGFSAGDFGDFGSEDFGNEDFGSDAGAPPSQEFEWESPSAAGGARSGRWVRRGGKIVLLGV